MSSYLVLIESNTTGTGRLFARAAIRQGARPILLTDDPARYVYAREERLDILQVNTADEKTLLAACTWLKTRLGIAGVISSSEYFVLTASVIARKLGLPGIAPEVIRKCRDKQAQRVCLQLAGVGVPAFRSACSARQAIEAAKELGFPVVVKPVSGTGSAGVKLCSNSNEVAQHAYALLRQKRNERGMLIPRRILVEELANGPEYSVEIFGARVIGITEKHLGQHPHFVEVGHDYPATLSLTAEAIITQEVMRATKALGLTWGGAHFELRLTTSGPKIIEVNPRLAGGYIPELVRLATGIDLISGAIRIALGQPPRLQKKRARHASIRFIMPPGEGLLAKVEGLERARRRPGVREVQLYARPGDRVHLRGDFRDRIGHVVATGTTPEASRERVETAHGMIQPLMALPSTQSVQGI